MLEDRLRPSTSETHNGLLPNVRAPIMARPTLPSFRWSERHLAPTRCGHCGARLLLGDVPTATYPKVDIGCIMCSRPLYELTYDGLRTPMTSEQFRALPPRQGTRGRPLSAVGTIVTRLVALLECGQPLTARDIGEHLNISTEQARNGACDARKQGHRVISRGGLYSLGGER